MRKEDSFLETWKLIMNILINDGLVTSEEIDKGFEIPYEWLYSSLINRNTILMAMRNVYEKKFPQNGYPLKNFKKYATIRYINVERKSCYRNFCW